MDLNLFGAAGAAAKGGGLKKGKLAKESWHTPMPF
jgi:hypothetical protein